MGAVSGAVMKEFRPLLRHGLANVPRRGLASGAADQQMHYRRLAHMYRKAPVNAPERFDARVRVFHEKAVIAMPPKPEFYHAAMALHGCNYFKMLDDAAFFAAQSVNTENFVVTTSFNTYITRPVMASDDIPRMISTGRVTSASKSLILAEAVMTLPDGTEVARGSGTFMPHPKFTLQGISTYDDSPELHEADDAFWETIL